ncbi:hypothetical protein B0T16DRAFT_317196 [Cercophora newfieldiana]|uniref:Uncharacterized protein n=1 Tax=Cercophora newfieldiana TaxID=92897 RepID=A0AA39YMX1_9PEZI|nr:hypothetical protein B0T16DRAFT_317196 [Cercophora newfieldiana]
MFDSSFQRSGVYFKTLQILRIFAQVIQRTRRDVELLNPEVSLSAPVLPLTSPDSDPTEDNMLQANWDILWGFYLEKEDHLLKRITNKTEEVKSLRDGLFNATSLREASRSTTMNRYVIVFTVMTVLYLPPSLVASVFGTELFTTDDNGETVTRFKVATVVTSISTYALGVFLIWIADRLDLPGILWERVTDWWQRTFNRATKWYGRSNWREDILASRKRAEDATSSA